MSNTTENNNKNVMMNKTIRVGVIVLMLKTLAENTGKNIAVILNSITASVEKKYGAVAAKVTDAILIDKQGSTHKLAYVEAGHGIEKQSVNPIMRLLGVFFNMVKGLTIANLTRGSGWGNAQANSMMFKTLKHYGFITGKNSTDWSLALSADGKKYPFMSLLTAYLADDDVLDIQEYVMLTDDINLDDINLDDIDDINLDDDEEVILVDSSTASGEEYFNAVMVNFVDNTDEDIGKGFVTRVFTTLAEKLTDACKLGAQLVMVNHKGEMVTRYSNKEALKALADGEESYTTSYNNKSSTTTFQSLASTTISSIKGQLINGICLSLHIGIKPKSLSKTSDTYSLLREYDITDATTLAFLSQGAALILDALDKGADVEDFGFGFIQHLNIDAVDHLFNRFNVAKMPMHKALTATTKRKISDGKALDRLNIEDFGFIN
jgi:hypothetical protein